jgi:single-stranded DNA-specific DHH superfamily exonuclease
LSLKHSGKYCLVYYLAMGRGKNGQTTQTTGTRSSVASESAIMELDSLPEGINLPEQTIPGVTEAASYLAKELEKGTKIAVFCDYDPDGTCAGESLRLALLPREITYEKTGSEQILFGYATAKKGFGLDSDFVESASEFGAKVLITLDCGSASVAAVAQAQSLGMKVIVLDHHQIADDNPTDFHLNPALHGESCASGSIVSWKFALALNHEMTGEISSFLLRRGGYLALFGARSDWMNIADDENSALVRYVDKYGSVPPGLETLTRLMHLPSVDEAFSELDAVLNLPKRTARAKAEWSAEVLKAETEEEAKEGARELLAVNDLSEEVLIRMLKAASSETISDKRVAYAKIQVPDGDDFTGHAGNVAHDLSQKYQKPAIAFIYAGEDQGQEIWRWAARNNEGPNNKFSFTDDLEAIREASTMPSENGRVASAGGHPQAVSGKCSADRVQLVIDAFCSWADKQTAWQQ